MCVAMFHRKKVPTFRLQYEYFHLAEAASSKVPTTESNNEHTYCVPSSPRKFRHFYVH